MTLVQKRNQAISSLAEYLDIPVLLSDQVQEEMPFPYVVYSVTTDYIPDAGLGDYSQHSGVECVEQRRSSEPSLTMSFTVCSQNRKDKEGNTIFGEDEAIEIAEKAQSFFLFCGRERMEKAGFVVLEVTGAGSRTTLVVDEAARRYGFDVRLRYRRNEFRTVPAVAQAVIVEE